MREIALEMIQKSKSTPYPLTRKQALNATHLVFHMISKRIHDYSLEGNGDFWENKGWKLARDWFREQPTKKKLQLRKYVLK